MSTIEGWLDVLINFNKKFCIIRSHIATSAHKLIRSTSVVSNDHKYQRFQAYVNNMALCRYIAQLLLPHHSVSNPFLLIVIRIRTDHVCSRQSFDHLVEMV